MGKYICLFALVSLAACKDKKVPDISQNENARDNILKVVMEVKIPEDDTFQLFYFEDASQASYKVEKRISVPVTRSDNFQKVEFELPVKLIPYKFRIDVGEKGLQTPVEIKHIKLEYNTNYIEIENPVFDRFFQTNIYLEKSKNTLIRKEVDGRSDPFFVSTALLIKKMHIEFLISTKASY
ncbi:hypothetical protein G3567_10130 [Psychroflexus sp. YR1-1]|uniref:Lipoprotein n=1 Tax=Psychroflexus aurantiacus TaxID=2709310 RepID=A0A6B3R1K9_9FLAO|nr:hypothetical protein [Psychroflexus aurantiacus]NEV94499.1 hypothetical protein [Psychroflexus aurantiacus]